MRIADDKLSPNFRVLSISAISAATDIRRWVAISRSADINSGSNDILVWCPDKDTDIFVMLYRPARQTIHYCFVRVIIST